MDDPAFRQQVREAQGNLMEMTSERLSDAAIRAAATMEELLDEVNAPNVQLVAAKAILEYGCRLQEQQDFEARLSALEERLSKQEGTKRSVS